MVDADWTPFQALGEQGVARMVERFYHYMDELPEAQSVRAMHQADLGEMHDKLTTFFVGWMGGPSRYRERFGGVNMPMAHMPFAIGEEEIEGWLACMQRALEDVAPDEPEDFVPMIMTRMRQMAEMLKNR